MSLPKTELASRIEKTTKLIEKFDLDFVFVYFDEYNVMNGRYLTGWCPSVERGAAIVSNYCDPFLIGGPEAGPYAKLESAISETVSSQVFMVPEEEYKSNLQDVFRNVKRETVSTIELSLLNSGPVTEDLDKFILFTEDVLESKNYKSEITYIIHRSLPDLNIEIDIKISQGNEFIHDKIRIDRSI